MIMEKKKSSAGSQYRKKAETRLKKQVPESAGFSDTDPAALLHELQVHQVELELQNEELRQQRDRAEDAIRKYADLYSEIYDFTPVAYFSFTREGIILESNLKASELLGIPRSYLKDRNFRNFLPLDMRITFNKFLEEAFSKPGRVQCEIKLVKSDRSFANLILDGTLSENEEKCLAMATDITELKKTQEDLIKSEQSLHSLLTASSELLYRMNADWSEMLQLNSKGFLSNTEKPNRNWMKDYIPPSDEPIVTEKINEAIRKKSVFELEHRVNQANGSLGWVYSRAIPIIDQRGEIVEWFGAASNITVRKEFEISLIESNRIIKEQLAEIENLYRNVPVGLCVLDLDLHFLRINERLAELNGIPAEEHIGRTVAEIVPDLSELASDIVKKILSTGKPQLAIELSATTSAQPGVIRYWSENWSPVKNDDDEIIAINVAVIEITEQKHTHEKLKKNQVKLRKAKLDLEQSKKKLMIALESGKIGLWEWDVAKNTTTWDSKMEEMFGLDPGTFDGKHSTFENLVHEDDLPQIRISMRKALTEASDMELVYRTKERAGKSNYIMSKAIIIKDSLKNPVNVIGVCFDVTRIQEGAEKHIVKLNEELLRSNNDLRQFAYVASHDLQEPLRMVSSFMQLLRNRYSDKLDQDAREYIEFAVDGAKRMYELLNALLAYSRVHTREHEFTKTDMKEVVERVKNNLGLIISESDAEISCDVLPVVLADDNQMIQVMQNLVENGIKFNTGKPRISITSEMNDSSEYLIKVSDNGIGIDSQYHERIFRIFQRLHQSADYKGTGIGLAICKRIIERHGGRIWVESTPGKGSTFFFTIPG